MAETKVTKTWLVEENGKVSLEGTTRTSIKQAEFIVQPSDFARIALGLLAIERDVGKVKPGGPPRPNTTMESIGQQQIFYHFFDTYKKGYCKALGLQSVVSMANWFRTCNSEERPNRAGRPIDELVGDFLRSSRSFGLQDFPDVEPEFLKFIETAQAAQALIVKTRKRYSIVMPHEKAAYQARALQDGVKLMPGEPWTTICWQKKMQSHVLGKMLNEKKFKGGFVPMYGPVPVEYCLPEDLVCPGSIFEVTEVDAEVVKPTKRQTTDEGEASPKKRAKTSAKVSRADQRVSNKDAVTAERKAELEADEGRQNFYLQLKDKIPMLEEPEPVILPEVAEIFERWTKLPQLSNLPGFERKKKVTVRDLAREVLVEGAEKFLHLSMELASNHVCLDKGAILVDHLIKQLQKIEDGIIVKHNQLTESLNGVADVYRQLTVKQAMPIYNLAMKVADLPHSLDYFLVKPSAQVHPSQGTTQKLLSKEDLFTYNKVIQKALRKQTEVSQALAVEKDVEIQNMKEQLAKNQAEMDDMRKLMQKQMEMQQKLLEQTARIQLNQGSSGSQSRADASSSVMDIPMATPTPDGLTVTPEPSLLGLPEKEESVLNQRIDSVLGTFPGLSK